MPGNCRDQEYKLHRHVVTRLGCPPVPAAKLAWGWGRGGGRDGQPQPACVSLTQARVIWQEGNSTAKSSHHIGLQARVWYIND